MTDHAQKASILLEQAQMTQAGPDVAQMLAMAAQAHATLALVAAQETANMIAYASHRIDHPMATQARTTTMLQMLGDLDFNIREALHVNPGS